MNFKHPNALNVHTADELVESALVLNAELGLSMSFTDAINAVLKSTPTPECEARVIALARNINELSDAGYRVVEGLPRRFEWYKLGPEGVDEHYSTGSFGSRLETWRDAARHFVDN